MSALPLAVSAVSGVASSKIKQLQTSVGYAAGAAVAAVIGAVFLIIAATAALSAEVGFITACLIMAGLFFAIALVIVLLRQRALKRKKRTAKVDETNAIIATAAANALTPTSLSLAALAAGYALSKK